MTLGDILYFETDQAIGHDSRWKYHLFLGYGNYRLDGNVFMFINKANNGSCFPIYKADYNFFPLNCSYIGCTGLIAYSDSELAIASPQYKGRLSDDHLRELCNHISNCDTMTGWEIKLAFEHLRVKL